ncbi:flagellar hook-length control protein FliK [Arsenophonus sp.]|uniref:flagellar hook-length control protein FliK n=1 Tax=Arsenophonus sp. TaxID=1872640 RepID=UPI002856D988|nr:flagellar hook-length control protein FliK [Arsenophonus sp.]MDR5615821.1 flagellar hook-length control protein FliK [Arsenophonus sp.]
MIDTSVTFSAGAHSSKQQLSSPTEDAANFADMLANYSSPAKEKNPPDSANSDLAQQENELSAINGFLADEVTEQINDSADLSLEQELTLLTDNQLIDQLPISLATIASQLKQENSPAGLSEELPEQANSETLTDDIDHRNKNLSLKHFTLLSTTNDPSIDFPLSNLSSPFVKPDAAQSQSQLTKQDIAPLQSLLAKQGVSPSQSLVTKQDISPSEVLLPPIQANIAATSQTQAIENPALATGSITNNTTISLTSLMPNSTTLSHSISPTINSIALATPIDHPEWGQKFSEQILFLSRHGSQQAELRLYPEELGNLQIQLKVFDDKAQLSIVAANQQVRQVIETNLPQLRHALSEQGIELGQTHVGDQHNKQHSDENSQPFTSPSSIADDRQQQTKDDALVRSQPIMQTAITTGIDIFA